MRESGTLKRRFQIFTENRRGCIAFAMLALFGVLVGHAVYKTAYQSAWELLIASLGKRIRPAEAPLNMLLPSLLVPLTYGVWMAAVGYARGLLPLWGAAVLTVGFVCGVRFGAAMSLEKLGCCGGMRAALVLTSVLTLPGYLYVSLLPLCRHARMRSPLGLDEGGAYALSYVLPVTALTLIETTGATCVDLFGLNALVH